MHEIDLNIEQQLVEPVKKSTLLDNWIIDAPTYDAPTYDAPRPLNTISNNNSESNTDHTGSTEDYKGNNNNSSKGGDEATPLDVPFLGVPPVGVPTLGVPTLTADLKVTSSEFSVDSPDHYELNVCSSTNTTGSILLNEDEDCSFEHDQTIDNLISDPTYDEGYEDIKPFVDLQDPTETRYDVHPCKPEIETSEEKLIDLIIARQIEAQQFDTQPNNNKRTERLFRSTGLIYPQFDYTKLLKNKLDGAKGETSSNIHNKLSKLSLPYYSDQEGSCSFMADPKLEQTIKQQRDQLCIDGTFVQLSDTTSLSEEHSLDIIQDIDDKSCLIVTSHIPVPSNYRYEFMTTPKIEVFKLPKEELIIGQDSIKKEYKCQVSEELSRVCDKFGVPGALVLPREKRPPERGRVTEWSSFQAMADDSNTKTQCISIQCRYY